MDLAITFAFFQVVFIDIIMAADNAIVVGMAAAMVAAKNRLKVIIYGTILAVILRIVFALVAVQLLHIIGLVLAGGLLLLYVAWDMYRQINEEKISEENRVIAEGKKESLISRAVMRVVLADVSMSLDNVLAVAGAAQDYTGVLVAGLFVSVVLMAFAASALAKVIKKHSWIEWLGLAIVTYVALSMIWRGFNELATTFY